MSGGYGGGHGPRATSGLEQDERWARAAWAFLTEPRDAGVVTLLEESGAVEALLRLRAGQLPARNGWDVRLPELDLDGMARAARHHGVRVLVPGDPEWPVGLDRLKERPTACSSEATPTSGRWSSAASPSWGRGRPPSTVCASRPTSPTAWPHAGSPS